MRLASLLVTIPLLAACTSSSAVVRFEPIPKVSAATIASSPAPLPVITAAKDIPLSFDRGIWHIEGTLKMPAHTEGVPVPAVVIVHGSGPMSRDGLMPGQIGLGFGFDLPVYRLLADALALRGYAVYRYDKRTCGQFNGCAETGFTSIPFNMLEMVFATKEYVGDAEAAMDAVQNMPAIDPNRTYFIGHSEGGELVPMLLAERTSVRAGVMLAPPFHTMAVVLEQQSARLRWAFSMVGESARAAKEGDILLDAAHSLSDIENGRYLGGLILGQTPGAWASWLEIAKNAPIVARNLDRPLLVLGGGYDYNIATSEIDSWAQCLAGAQHVQHRVKVFPCVTHALNCIAEPDPSRIRDTDIGHDIDAGLLKEIVAFLEAN